VTRQARLVGGTPQQRRRRRRMPRIAPRTHTFRRPTAPAARRRQHRRTSGRGSPSVAAWLRTWRTATRRRSPCTCWGGECGGGGGGLCCGGVAIRGGVAVRGGFAFRGGVGGGGVGMWRRPAATTVGTRRASWSAAGAATPPPRRRRPPAQCCGAGGHPPLQDGCGHCSLADSPRPHAPVVGCLLSPTVCGAAKRGCVVGPLERHGGGPVGRRRGDVPHQRVDRWRGLQPSAATCSRRSPSLMRPRCEWGARVGGV